MATNAISDMLRQTESPTRSRRKVVRKDQLRYWRSLHNWLCISRFLSEKIYSTWTWKTGIRSHRQILQGNVAPHQKFRTEKLLREELFKSVNLTSAIRVLPDLRVRPQVCGEDNETLHQENQAWRKLSTSSKNKDKATFYSLLGNKRSDSGASFHFQNPKGKNSRWTAENQCTCWAQNHHNGVDRKRRGANPRGGTSVLSRSWSLRELDDTHAVLSLAKLSEEHGYTYEWCSGKQPRLTKLWKNILCKTENVVPMVVLGLPSQAHRQAHHQGPVSERSDELAPGNRSRNAARDSEHSNDHLRDLPAWLEEFIENLENTEVPAAAHISHDSGSERPKKWHQGSTVFILTSQKTRIAKSACEPKWQGLFAEDVLAQSNLVQKILVICLQQITKSSMRDVNQETITGTLSWYKILLLDGCSLIRVKRSLYMRRREVCQIFWSLRTDRKLYTQTTRWERMWNFIMESPHFNTSSIRDKWHCWKSCFDE